MFKSLFQLRNAPPPPRTQGRWYAVGDVHGCLPELDVVIARIEADDAKRGGEPGTIIFVGDLIDRGPDSAGVIDRVLALKRRRPSTRVIMGNHEEMFLAALEGDARALKLFTRVGGAETIQSYGVSGKEYREAEYEELHAMMQTRVPAEHVAFLRSMEDVVVADDYVFVHAGVRPGVALADQKPSDLRWIRDRFLRHTGMHEKVVIHGHTITEAVDERPNRIGIDTGAYATGLLTAIGLESDQRWYLTS